MSRERACEFLGWDYEIALYLHGISYILILIINKKGKTKKKKLVLVVMLKIFLFRSLYNIKILV